MGIYELRGSRMSLDGILDFLEANPLSKETAELLSKSEKFSKFLEENHAVLVEEKEE